jgi:hypothetical protein
MPTDDRLQQGFAARETGLSEHRPKADVMKPKAFAGA